MFSKTRLTSPDMSFRDFNLLDAPQSGKLAYFYAIGSNLDRPPIATIYEIDLSNNFATKPVSQKKNIQIIRKYIIYLVDFNCFVAYYDCGL